MTIKFIKEAVEVSQLEKHPLVTYLTNNMKGYVPVRALEELHASSLTQDDFCPRRRALMILLNKTPKDQYLNAALKATFDMGRAVETLVREDWAKEIAYGNWRCRGCGHYVSFSKKPEEHCPDCNNLDWVYEEIFLISKTYGYQGSFDLLVDLGAPSLYLVEIKIIAANDFEKITAPLAEHRIRTNLYMHLIEDSGSDLSSKINVHKAFILYVSRGYGKKNQKYDGEILPFKDFTVNRDEEVIQPLLEKASQVKEFFDSKKVPQRICKTSYCKMAKFCPVVKECFSGKYL